MTAIKVERMVRGSDVKRGETDECKLDGRGFVSLSARHDCDQNLTPGVKGG